MSTGKRWSCASDETPVPKSSIAIRTPSRVQLLKLVSGPVAGRPLLDDRGLGHLQADAARGQPGLLEHRADERLYAAVRELPAGEVDPGDERLGERSRRATTAPFARRLHGERIPRAE